MKKYSLMFAAILVAAVCLILCDTYCAYANRMISEDGDNSICPVTRQAITVKKSNSIYAGKRYWFSSYDAVLEFDKNPEKYLKNLQGYKPAAPAAGRAVSAQKPAQTSKPAEQEASQNTSDKRGWWR